MLMIFAVILFVCLALNCSSQFCFVFISVFYVSWNQTGVEILHWKKKLETYQTMCINRCIKIASLDCVLLKFKWLDLKQAMVKFSCVYGHYNCLNCLNCVYRWPLLIDSSPQTSTFLRYRDTNFLNALNPKQMEPDVIRLALLGALRSTQITYCGQWAVHLLKDYPKKYDTKTLFKALINTVS